MRKLIAIAVPFLASCSSMMEPTYYEGGKQPDSTMAIYTLQMASSYWSSARTYTLTIDDKKTVDMVAMLLSEEAFGNVALKPGRHVMKVSFIDTENVLLPTYLKENKFQGTYTIEASLVAGKYYGIKFKEKNGQSVMDEVCLVEADQSGGISALRGAKNYLVCSKSSMPASDENIKTCKAYLGTPQRVTNHPENCGVKE